MTRKHLQGWTMQVTLIVIFAVVSALLVSAFWSGGILANADRDDGGTTHIPPGVADQGQAAVLADGVVTRAEYDAAVDKTLECVRAAGGTISDLRYEDFRTRPIYTFNISYDHAVSPEDASPYDVCWIQHSRDVQAQWVIQHEPSEATRAENEARGLACAKEENLDVASAADLLGLVSEDNPGGAMRCRMIAFKGYDPLDHVPGAED